jgi:hypothetical protein|tara:strand:- start:3956 stop:4150 length:195 start_codon:yes stop_codon:yes gene_type:complete
MTIWDEFVQTLNEEINNLRVSLGNGSASDYAEYKQMVGTLAGLEWSRDRLTDIVKKRIYDEDEE